MRRSVISFAITMVVFVLASVLLIFAIYLQAATWLLALLGVFVVVPIPVATTLLYFIMKPYLEM